MDTIEQFGNEAYKKTLWGDYKGAVDILTKAISRYPFEKMLYHDRSVYYHKLKDYKNALQDVERVLKLSPNYIRAHFRKGEVLLDLKEYRQAESVFRDILTLDGHNKEAKIFLKVAQVNYLMDNGKYWMIDVKRALEFNNYDTNRANTFLEIACKTSLHDFDADEIYYSEDDEEGVAVQTQGVKTTQFLGGGDYDPLSDPNNPLQTNALWIGNVTLRVNEQNLEPIFSKYGKIKSIVVQHKSSCAFVNYTHPGAAANAMRNFPKILPLEDTHLIIRFPESARINSVAAKRKPAEKRFAKIK